MKPFNLLSMPKITTANGLTRYQWEDYQVPGVSTDDNEARWVNQYARVQVSDYNNWAEIVNWGLAINPIQTNFTGELADTIANFKKRFKNDKEKYFRAAVGLVQDEVRYMGIETGPYSHKANTPGKVFSQRYGDCKDKSLLLASLLNAGGIEAHLALINTNLQNEIENYIPSTSLFNHAVVVANISGKQVWVDATMANQGGEGTNIYFPAYFEGLILKPGNGSLTKIEETKKGKIVCEESYKITNEYSPVKLTVKTTYTLDQADDTRDHIASTGIAQTEKNYLDYYAKTYTKIKAPDSVMIEDDKKKNELSTIENYVIEDFFKQDTLNRKYNANIYADLIAEQLPEITGQITTPVGVEYPCAIDYTIDITMPNGWDINNEHYSINRAAYTFTSDKTASGNDLLLHYQFAYLKSYISRDNLSEFTQDIKDLKDDKLQFNFIYTPNINIVPFRINRLMFIIAFIVAGLFAYVGLKVYRTETSEVSPYNNNFLPALRGWLIVLVIVLFAIPLNVINTLIDDRYFSMSRWDLVTTGIKSVVNRILLVFETAGYLSLICYSVFCLILVFKKRDIAPDVIKKYYLFMVIFLLLDYLFNGYVNGEFSNYEGKRILEAVVAAGCWTYYLNVSTRVKQTFIVPYIYHNS